MKSRILPLIASAALIGALTLAPGIGVSAAGAPCTTACYVAPGGSDANGGGALDDAKLTIQAAVDQVDVGGTVRVAAGTYDEQVVIDGKNLTLQGAGATTVIRPLAPATLSSLYTYPAGTFWPGTVMASVILVRNAGAVTVRDLEVDGAHVTTLPAGAGRVAGVLYGESGGTIDNVTVTTMDVDGYATRSYGIDLSAVGAARSVEVKDSHITNWSRNGIQAQGASLTADIHDNTLTGPGDVHVAGAVPNGILFIHGSAGKATHNTITSIHHSATDSRSAGILFYDPLATGIVVEGNDISHVDDGVDVSHNANDVIVRLNNLHDNVETGIHLEDGATNTTITGNAITNNGMAGIRFAGASDPGTPDDPPGTGNVAHGNRIAGNAVGVADYDTQVFDATDNWWGCNPGPVLSDCDGVTGSVTFSPWLVLRLSVASAILQGTTHPATADVTHDSSDADASGAGHIPDGTAIAFSAATATVSAATAGTMNGHAQVALAANLGAGSGSVSATLDDQTVSTPILVVAPPPPAPSPSPSASPTPTPSPTPSPTPTPTPTTLTPAPTLTPTPTPPLNVTPAETVRPRIVKQVPGYLAPTISPRTTIRLVFSEPIGNVPSTGVRFLNISTGATVAAILHYDGPTKTLTITPRRPLRWNTTYRLEIHSTITDLAGNSLIGGRWTFRLRG